ncbi:MAG TPA: sugar phosphate isomerase/epimerase family protein [Bryobacteraceae bacterium]|nr:sugar phosphate isomerase/epimerase family protein [Bryobacteraceae bacterium]
MEVGLVFWGEKNPAFTIRQVKALGLACGHLGFAGHVRLGSGIAQQWKEALDENHFTVTTIWAAHEGESYADIPTVQRTVGFIPPETRDAREARAREVIDTGVALGIPSFACHIGFVPEERDSSDYNAVRNVVRRICDYAGDRNMSFALETGQERAELMRDFLADVDRENLKINFDPANMILYGTAEPIPALEQLAPWVVSVHCKDANWPPKDVPGALGTEMPLGQGVVNINCFVAKLKEIGYKGPLTIEREVSLDQEMDDRHKEGLSHLQDIRDAIALLTRLRDEA